MTKVLDTQFVQYSLFLSITIHALNITGRHGYYFLQIGNSWTVIYRCYSAHWSVWSKPCLIWIRRRVIWRLFPDDYSK